MNKEVIEDAEVLYRVVRNSSPETFINNKPKAALFMDENGVSVERNGDRDENDIIDTFKARFNCKGRNDYKTSVKISAYDCRKVDTYPTPIHNKKNKFHAEIHDSEQNVLIPMIKAMQLASLCKIVEQA